MNNGLITEKQDLTYLSRSKTRNSSGTAGSFLKAQSELGGKKTYYKLSDYDSYNGIVGHECVNELIVDRLLAFFGVKHLSYTLINADIRTADKTVSTYLCASEDYKKPGEDKTALDAYYEIERNKDEGRFEKPTAAYLLYYENDKRFYIELPDNIDEWDVPLLLSSLVKRGERTAGSYWSELWVRERIVPLDRQNIGQILKDNGLKAYDEFQLLLLSGGRCEQDSYYIEEISEKTLPTEFLARLLECSRQNVDDLVKRKKLHPLRTTAKSKLFYKDEIVQRMNKAGSEQ